MHSEALSSLALSWKMLHYSDLVIGTVTTSIKQCHYKTLTLVLEEQRFTIYL